MDTRCLDLISKPLGQQSSSNPLASSSPYLRMAAATLPRLKWDVHIWQHKGQCHSTQLIRPWLTYQWALTGACWLPSWTVKASSSQPMGCPSLAFNVFVATSEGRLALWGKKVSCEAPGDTSLWDGEAWWAWGSSSFLDSCFYLPTNHWKFPSHL